MPIVKGEGAASSMKIGNVFDIVQIFSQFEQFNYDEIALFYLSIYTGLDILTQTVNMHLNGKSLF